MTRRRMTKLSRWIGIVLVATYTLMPAEQARAACRASGTCLWVDKNFSTSHGCPLCFTTSRGNLHTIPNGQCHPPNAASTAHNTWGDCASSIFSYQGCCTITLYRDVFFKVPLYSFANGPLGNGVGNLRSAHANDTVSSVKVDCSAATKRHNCR